MDLFHMLNVAKIQSMCRRRSQSFVFRRKKSDEDLKLSAKVIDDILFTHLLHFS